MKCTRCKEQRAIIQLRQHRAAFCKDCFTLYFHRQVEKTIKEFNMLDKDDSVLIGVSGGKDSLVLWHVLDILGYKTLGLYIDLGIGEYSEKSKEKVQKFADMHNLPVKIIDLSAENYSIPLVKSASRRAVCSACGSIKRYNLNKIAKELNYNVVATGHNLDDEAAFLFLNVLNWNVEYLKRQYPVLAATPPYFVKKIKPLIRITEKETTVYALVNKIPYIIDECPYAVGATQIYYKKILNQLEQERPGTKLRFLLQFLRSHNELFKEPAKTEPPILQNCKICGEATNSDICTVCRLKMQIKAKLIPPKL